MIDKWIELLKKGHRLTFTESWETDGATIWMNDANVFVIQRGNDIKYYDEEMIEHILAGMPENPDIS